MNGSRPSSTALNHSPSAFQPRVAGARAIQTARFAEHPKIFTNSDAQGTLLTEIASPDAEGRDLLGKVAEKFGLTARGYHRILRVARTIADLEGSANVHRHHIGEAVSYRLTNASL